MIKPLQFLKNIIIAIAVIVGSGYVIKSYYTNPIKEYCDSASTYKNKTDAEQVAIKNGFIIITLDNNQDRLVVLNHRNFAFRFQCTINYSETKYIRHELITAD